MNNPPGHSRQYLQSEEHKLMGQEYSKLPQRYIKFYMSRMTVFAMCFFGAVAYCNGYFQIKGEEYMDFRGRKEFQDFGKIVKIGQNMIDSMIEMSKMIIEEDNLSNQTMYCGVDKTNQQCKKFLMNYELNQVVMKKYGLYPSYQCLLGDCVRVAELVDYYWRFKATLPYFYLNEGLQRFIVPPLKKINNQNILTNLNYNQRLHFYNGNLILIKQLNSASLSIKIGFILDQSFLLSNYQININNYNYNIHKSPSNSHSFTYKNTYYFDRVLPQQYFSITKWAYTFLFMFIGLLIGIPVVYIFNQLINNWFFKIFKELSVLNNLYKYQINSIFQGKQPKTSVVLNQTCFTEFYQDLAQIVGKDAQPCKNEIQNGEKQQPFKFLPLVQKIMDKFEQSCKPIQQQRSKQFSNLKLPIRTAVSEISENVNTKLKDIFMKSRELNLCPQFFHFGYLCLLQPTPSYQNLLLQQSIPLPSAMIELFRYMNHTINSQDLKFTFKFAFNYDATIQQQIIIKLQDNLLQKYLNALTSLDIGDPNYAVKLKLKKRLVKLEKEMENRRHVFVAYLK